jgi:hypothetical protein
MFYTLKERKYIKNERRRSWTPEAHACNPSYSGDRLGGSQSMKPAQANSLQDPISKIPDTKRAGGVV